MRSLLVASFVRCRVNELIANLFRATRRSNWRLATVDELRVAPSRSAKGVVNWGLWSWSSSPGADASSDTMVFYLYNGEEHSLDRVQNNKPALCICDAPGERVASQAGATKPADPVEYMPFKAPVIKGMCLGTLLVWRQALEYQSDCPKHSFLSLLSVATVLAVGKREKGLEVTVPNRKKYTFEVRFGVRAESVIAAIEQAKNTP